MDWGRLEHHYGSAADIPGLLERAADPDPEVAGDAVFHLLNNLYHQGGWVCSAAPAALPHLLDLAGNPAVHHRPDVIEVIWRLAYEATRVTEVDPAWPGALAAAAPRIVALLDDIDPAVRREALMLIANAGLPAGPALWRRWTAETDPAVRLDVLLAFGDHLTADPDAADARDLLHRVLTGDGAPQARVAAAIALSGPEPHAPLPHAAFLTGAIRRDDVTLWTESAWYGGGDDIRRTMAGAVSRLFRPAGPRGPVAGREEP